MKLITKEIQKKLPALKAQDGLGDEAVAYLKLFTPDGQWTWYVTEYNPETGKCFGLVHGFETELGYFDINELAQVKGPLGLPVERDRFFEPTKLKDLK